MKLRVFVDLISTVLTPLILAACQSGNSTAPNTSLVWSSVPSGTPEYPYDVWGSSVSDVWAVGDNGTILHYNGTSWSSVSRGTTQNLISVWGASASDVWAVGILGTMLHYNGTSWSSVPSGTLQSLAGVWGGSASDVWVVGMSGTILHGSP